ncbi:MAG: DNA polymerase subunit beta [Legionellales bacterium]|nr:DNA polymerase subunit beta [Legionellales bacterium]|tara:strand:+ start:40127 stop:40447 length:321 start_codon:yes stop_codon:yes gene_type:complete
MRISSDEKKAFSDVILKYVIPPAELRLFGSRADDSAKGGDIDLLLIVESDAIRSTIAFNKADILSEIKTIIGDQKIDLVITTREKMQSDAFLQSVYPGSVLLEQFE